MCVIQIIASLLASTKAIYKSAYYIAKNDRPYSDHFGFLELQQLNGVDIGVGLHSRYSAVEIIDHILKEMKCKIIRQILEISGKLSIIFDESTSLGATSTLIVYLKCEVSNELPPYFLFLDLIELPDQKSETVFEHLLNCLNKHGFHDNYLKENLVAFASDGASVMLRKNSGIAKKLVTKYTNIVLWHCMNRRLEWPLNDAVDERQLNECAAQLDQQVKKIGKLLCTRWSGTVLPPCIIIFPHQKMTKVEVRLSKQCTVD
ncbi:hypothetical protein PR048_026474 [Dryococelus australis]|uniref:DUF4371 domain-containing protein n=1 Tax=Dryococelus australis TaxID=614101 RepID=A0ABQ9GLH9_9NEOP|nr:hypothetical protein PR048_026474 [Dryococelus australis]